MTYTESGKPLTLDSEQDRLTSDSGHRLAHIPQTADSLTAPSDPSIDDDRTRSPETASFDSLTYHSEPVVVGLDWEKDGWRVSYGGAPAITVSRADLIGYEFKDVSLVVVEQAHMRERNIYSVAQVYTEEELRRLRFRSKIRMFPGKLIWRASEFAGHLTADGRPDKAKDAESLAVYAAAHLPETRAWKPHLLPGEDPNRRLWPARDKLRDDLREALNPLRAAWNGKSTAEKYALPEVARFCALLEAVFDDLPKPIKDQYGIKRTRNGIRVERMTAALTLYLSTYDRAGSLRRRPDGEFIGVRFILDAIGMSHSHKPNMARSQIMWHSLPHYKKKSSQPRDKALRTEYMRNLRQFLAIMRDADPLTYDSEHRLAHRAQRAATNKEAS